MSVKKIVRLSLWGVLVYLLVNGLVVGLISFKLYQVKRLMSLGELLTGLAKFEEISRDVALLRFTSLGATNWPYLTKSLLLLESLGRLSQEVRPAASQIQSVFNWMLTGTEYNKDQLEMIWRSLPKIELALESVRETLESRELEVLSRYVAHYDAYLLITNKLPRLQKIVNQFVDHEPDVARMLGFGDRQHYVVLLQNNMELRPTGGYMGSYAEVWMNQGAMERILIQDIGFPNGQIKGYVPEPKPLSTYLFEGGTPGWQLRDSNWEPDFREAAVDITWFFEEGGLEPIDGLVGVNLLPVKELLTLMGPLEMADYHVVVNEENFYSVAQRAAEENFFPGSTQKGDFLGAVGRGLLNKLIEQPPNPVQLSKLVLSYLEKGDITIALSEGGGSDWMHTIGWDGAIFDPQEGDGVDFWMLVEANLGINKANCCLTKMVEDEITVRSNEIEHEMRFTIKNLNPAKPNPPDTYGGGYKDYLRVLLPKKSRVVEVLIDGQRLAQSEVMIEQLAKHTSLGFLHLTNGGVSSTAEIRYKILVEEPGKNKYRLVIQKQPGIEMLPVKVNILKKGITQDSILVDGVKVEYNSFWLTKKLTNILTIER